MGISLTLITNCCACLFPGGDLITEYVAAVANDMSRIDDGTRFGTDNYCM